MSLSYPSSGQRPTFASLLRSFACDPGLAFADVLPEQLVLDLCREEGVDFASAPEGIWTPAVTLWAWLSGTHRVGDREGRCEPRKVKRRPKPYPRLTKPRAQEQAELLKGAKG